jgi:hypothetical protein
VDRRPPSRKSWAPCATCCAALRNQGLITVGRNGAMRIVDDAGLRAGETK